MKNEASYSYKYNLNSSAVNSITRKENRNVSLFWTPWFFLAERESFPSWFVCTRLQMDCSHFGRNKAKRTCVLFIPNKVGVKAQKLGCTVRQWKSNFHCATCVHTILQQYSMCSNSQTLPNKPFYVSSVAFCVPRFSNPNNPSSQSKVKKPQRKEKKKKKKRKKNKKQRTNRISLSFIAHSGAEVAGWRGGLWSLSIPEGKCDLIYANKTTTVHPEVLPCPWLSALYS